MSKLWMASLPAIFIFGPMVMTNMGAHGTEIHRAYDLLLGLGDVTSDSDGFVSFGAAFLVGMGLLSMFKRMNKQDQLIKELQSQIGGSNEQTAGS